MRRISCLLLVCLFLFTICFQTVASAAASDIVGAYAAPLVAGDSINADSISIWGNYIFASTVDNGLEIIDMESYSVIAAWQFDNTIIPGLNSFASEQTVVTDEYIICSNGTYIVVFPNEGKYTDTPPEMIVRISPSPANAFRSFNQLSRMFVKDGYLYLFDITERNELDAVDGEANHVVAWKVPLELIANPTYEYEAQKWMGLGDSSIEYVVLGEYEYLWNTVEIDDNYAYCVTYNDELLLPKKTLFVNTVNLDTLEVSSGKILQNSASGLQTEFRVAGEVDMDYIRSLELYVARVSDTERVPLSSFLDVENTEYLMIDIEEDNGVSTVKIMFSEDVIGALVDVFNCSEDDVVNNGIVFAVDVDGAQKQFTYITNEVAYATGIIALDSRGGNAYVMTGTATGRNVLLSIDTSGNEISVIGRKAVTPIGTYDIAMDAVCVGDYLIALYKGPTSIAAVYDISSPGNIPYNFAFGLNIRDGIFISNTLSSMVYYGNRYYYASTLGNRVGMFETDESARFANITARDAEMPVRVYGYSSDYDEVQVTLDDGDTINVPVHDGIWSYLISMANNGAHTVTVDIGGYSESFDYTVDVPLPMSIEEAGYDENDAFYAVIANNTLKYESSLHNESIRAVAVAYDSDGNRIPGAVCEVNDTIPYGEEKVVHFDVEEGSTIKIYVLDQNMDPLTTAYTYDGQLRGEETPTVAGSVRSMSLNKSVVDANNKVIHVGGQVDCDGTRPVSMYVSVGGQTYDIQQITCNEDGTFEFEYSYANDNISGDAVYDIRVSAMMDGIANIVSESVSVMDSSTFESHMNNITNNVVDGEALLGYLENEKQFAREAGMDIDDADFSTLSTSDKVEVMDEMLEIIKSGDRTTLADAFKAKSAEVKEATDTVSAIEEINSSIRSSLYGVLEKYKDLIDISDSVWNRYSKHKNISLVSKYFLEKGDITDLSQVESRLDDAIDKADDNSSSGSTKESSRGGIRDTVVPANPPDLTTANPEDVHQPEDVTFVDLDSASWAKDAILSLAEKGIVNGITRTEFYPVDGVTREQFVKMLVIAFGLEDSTAECTFSDVDSGAWYYEYVAAAQKCGLAEGDGENFGIGRPMTREEMATFAYRAASIAGIALPEKVEASQFVDGAEIADYAVEAISAMQKAGIINGVDGNRFAPSEGCTRAMAAKVVYELLNI